MTQTGISEALGTLGRGLGGALTRLGGPLDGPVHARAAVTIRRPIGEVYARWRAKSPAGSVEWDAEILQERPDELIAWRSLPGGDVEHSGAARFVEAPGDRGTEVHVELTYSAPGGRVAPVLAKLTGEDPRQQLKDDLRRFKQVLETGEVVRSDATPEGQAAPRYLHQRPAQPVETAAP